MIEVALWNTPEEADLVRRRWDQDFINEWPIVGERAAHDLSIGADFQFLISLIRKVRTEIESQTVLGAEGVGAATRKGEGPRVRLNTPDDSAPARKKGSEHG